MTLLEAYPLCSITRIYRKAVDRWEPDVIKEMRERFPKIDEKQLRDAIKEKLPSYDTVRPFCKKWKEPDVLDKPWSLGAPDETGISCEATVDLLDVWKYCLAIGHTFTIREAKWVARIRTAIQASENIYQYRGALLFGYAHEYAIRERISKILKSHMDTHDIDSNLCFQERDWDWVVFRAMGIIPRLSTKYFNKELSEHNFLGIYFNTASYVAEQNMPNVDPNRIKGLAQELSDKQAYMFAALLSYLSKGHLWKELSIMEHLPILDYLTDLVTKELVDEESFHTKGIYMQLDVSNWRDRPNGLTPEDVLSPDLLELVGYEVVTHNQNVDKPFSYLKNYSEHTRYKAVFTLNQNSNKGGKQ